MSLANVYTPHADSLPARVIAFFQRNPDEELSMEDITDKFDVVRGNIHSMLALAKDAGLVALSKDGDGAYIYKAGKQLARPQRPDAGVIIEPGWGATDKAARHAQPAMRDASLPPLSEIVIEDDVPVPNHKGNLNTEYTDLLKRLKPKQSFVLPIGIKHTLIKQIVALHKASQGRYTTRTDKEAQQVRVWRTA